MVNILNLPQNPDYGRGIFRRGVRLTNEPGIARGDLEDGMHGMRCAVHHDGERIVDITTDLPRLPMSTCGGASLPLRALVGLPLSTPFAWFYGAGRPQQNCTHLYDLVWYTIAQASRPEEALRRYEVIVPDSSTDRGTASLRRDGVYILNWVLENGVITAPAAFAGRAALRGFTPWALANLHGDDLEAALVLQKGYFVSSSRRVSSSAMVGPVAPREDAMKGVCWSFSSPQYERAERIDSSRDFTDPEALLRFR